MIPILFSKGSNVFTSNGQGRLTDTTNCIVHEQRNGIFELEMEMPTAGIHFDDIELGSIILAKPSPSRTAQPFRVYSIQKTMGDMMATICAEHIGYQLNMIPVMPFTASSANAALQGLVSHAAETNPFTFWTDVTRAGTYTQTIPSSARARLQGEQGSIVQTFGGEIEFDGWTVKLWTNRGIDRGTTIRYGKNLMSLEQEQSIQETITGIVPYWVGMDGETETVMWLPEVVVYSSHAGDFPTARTVCIDMSGDFQTMPTEAELRTAAQKYITDNNIGVPVVGFDISFATLAQTAEYASIALLERIDLCDFVTVIFPDFGISAQAKVVETYFDNLRERYTQIRIGDQHFTLADQIAQQSQDIVDSEAKQTNSYLQALEQATALINGDMTGASMITQTDADGNPVGLVFMDTNDPSTAVNCIRINSNGIGFSNNGVNGPYTSAWGINNVLDMSKINVINLIVDHLQSFGNNNTWQLDSQASYLDLRQLVNSVWKQRGALFINNADGGTLRVSKGDVDSSGNPLSGTSYRTFVRPQEITVGLDGSGTVQGTLTAKNINADSIRKLLINSLITTAGSYWDLDATGVRFFLIIGHGGNLFEQSIVIPNDSSYSFGSSHTYAIGDSTKNVQFNLSVVSGKVRVTIKSVTDALCYLNRCYGII